MQSLIRNVLGGAALLTAAGAIAETPAEIFQEMEDRERASLTGVQDFSVMKTMMGMCTIEHFEKATTESADGGAIEYMRLVPITEAMARNAPENAAANLSAEELLLAAADLRAKAPMVNQAMRNEIQGAGLAGGLGMLLMNPPGTKPWLSPMMGDMMNNYATMLEGAAMSKIQDENERARAAEEARQNPLAAVAEHTRIVGTETVIDRPAIHLVAEDLGYTQESNGQDFALDTLHLWVDAERYVPLKMQMEGTANDGGELRPMRIENENMSYESVDGCDAMYAPRRTVMRISGVLNAEEQAQMAEAQTQLAEFEAQMASMPDAQRDMIMRQMGPQLEMMRNMVAGQGIEMVTLTVGARCNGGVPSQEEYLQTAPGFSRVRALVSWGTSSPNSVAMADGIGHAKQRHDDVLHDT